MQYNIFDEVLYKIVGAIALLGLGLGLRQSFQLRFFMMSHQ